MIADRASDVVADLLVAIEMEGKRGEVSGFEVVCYVLLDTLHDIVDGKLHETVLLL